MELPPQVLDKRAHSEGIVGPHRGLLTHEEEWLIEELVGLRDVQIRNSSNQFQPLNQSYPFASLLVGQHPNQYSHRRYYYTQKSCMYK